MRYSFFLLYNIDFAITDKMDTDIEYIRREYQINTLPRTVARKINRIALNRKKMKNKIINIFEAYDLKTHDLFSNILYFDQKLIDHKTK